MLTGWGLYLKDDWSLRRISLCGMMGFIVSLVFGIVWSIKAGSISDGFAPAAYILGFEALVIATISFASVLGH